MKHQTINLVKFKALSKRLKLPRCWTVGVLESIWIFACHNARDGRLNRFTPLELAGWIEYPGDELELIEALVETKWLDRASDGSLSIHDWQQHRPNWLKGIESQTGKTHFSSEPSSLPNNEPSYEPSTELGESPSPRTPLPLTKPSPSLADPDLEPLSAEWKQIVDELTSEGMDFAVPACESARARGVLPSEARAMLEQWRARKPHLQIGLLYKRISNMRPETNPAHGWPDCPEWERQKSRDELERRQKAMANSRIAAKKEREKNSDELARLEAEFGPQLDGMSKPELREFATSNFPDLANSVPKRGPLLPGLLRGLLLAELESRAKHSLSNSEV